MELKNTKLHAPLQLAPLGPVNGHHAAPGDWGPLDAAELEAVALNIEASLRVYTSHHFFSWTQGLLQNLIPHEILICSLRGGDGNLSLVESFSTAAAEAEPFDRLYIQEPGLGERLVREWEENLYQPLALDAAGLAPESALSREFARIGASRLVAHGTYDTSGRMTSFFIFAGSAVDANPRRTRLVEILVPFLHAAWVRTKVSLSGEAGAHADAHAGARDLLTEREREVLKWVYLGKSNIEIGLILGISPLTVKNHVQEILRRLNVQNRAQAVGKAFSLHILSC
ncbi:MAG: LuxR C-terminal-related transcriptional regulator [Rhodocyclaceae bacterium]|nr:LuxR C-terminal-related transcriptional regulator [Rhodocyclaceae bacterium]